MAVRIKANGVVSNRVGAYVFSAADEAGPLQIWVTPTRWEEFWLQAPDPATSENRLDFAIGMVEYAASQIDAKSSTDGTRISFVG